MLEVRQRRRQVQYQIAIVTATVVAVSAALLEHTETTVLIRYFISMSLRSRSGCVSPLANIFLREIRFF